MRGCRLPTGEEEERGRIWVYCRKQNTDHTVSTDRLCASSDMGVGAEGGEEERGGSWVHCTMQNTDHIISTNRLRAGGAWVWAPGGGGGEERGEVRFTAIGRTQIRP